MSILANDPITQLAFSVQENKGVFALLLGSGVSRAAGIPTGWEITLDLIRRVALAQGAKEQADWAAWYRATAEKEPDYSALLEELGASPEERRSILHGYIEPTQYERDEGRKVPTAAHRAIADLVASGHLRVIITTNFDRLLENALREKGIEPTIVASVDALSGAEPLTHTACYILKLHGDYKDARILNIESELGGYPPAYDATLDRVLDEHGLIVCGWSGEWDHALRAAFLRAPNRRYSMFWAQRGPLGNGAAELISHRGAREILITDADSFFSGLQQRVRTLEESQRQNPVSIELQVASTKRFLAKPEYRIPLDELFSEEVSRLISALDQPEFSPNGSGDQGNIRSVISSYESAAETLASMVGVIGRWGDGSEFSLIVDIIRSLRAHAERERSGSSWLLALRSYPAVLILTAYGLGLTRSERWNYLYRLFNVTIESKFGDPDRVISSLFLWTWDGGEENIWRQLEGLERHKTPLSDHLFAIFSDWGSRFIGLVPDFEVLFERFEFLGSLVYLESVDRAVVQRELDDPSGQKFVWMPVGRSGWNGSTAKRLIAEVESELFKNAIVGAGFAKGDVQFIDLFVKNFRRAAGRMRW